MVSTPADALLAADALLGELRQVLVRSVHAFGEDDRRMLARTIRKGVANMCAEVDWILLDRLQYVDREVFRVLRELEPERGQPFRTTGSEIYERADASYSVVYVALRRLDALGLINRSSKGGNLGTVVTINWDNFTLGERVAA